MTSPERPTQETTDQERPWWFVYNLNSPTGKGVSIAVIDSGWDHSLNYPQVQKGVGLVDPENPFAVKQTADDQDRIGHGTGCIDLILHIAPEATILPVRIFGEKLETSLPLLQAAIHWAIEQQVQIINLSLGTLRKDAVYPLYMACEEARKRGSIIVAARSNSESWSYPAIFDNVIGVSPAPLRSPFDFHYEAEEAIECLAKGDEQQILWLGGKRQTIAFNGSFAAPHISGVVALLLQRHPRATLEQIHALLTQYAINNPGPSPASPPVDRSTV